ncbi:MAG: hypothetical protein WHT06_15660 [Desulfobacterales bacterium]
MRAAHAVILPQGCTAELHRAARKSCARIFPNYDARFRYPGKSGQIALFRALRLPHPKTVVLRSVRKFPAGLDIPQPTRRSPLVFKCDWGGEGETVFLLSSRRQLAARLRWAERLEAGGQRGFLLQEFVPCGHRSLRVVVIGDRRVAYWRTQDDAAEFRASLAAGARIDRRSDPALRRRGEDLVARLCRLTGINLAGIDLVFDERENPPAPLLLEINYCFGRTGIGGSTGFYRLLREAARRWLRGIDGEETAGKARRDGR